MGKHRSTIELNGRRYDAVTGLPLGQQKSLKTHSKMQSNKLPVVTDVVAPIKPSASKISANARKSQSKPALHSTAGLAAMSLHQRTKRSATLKRQSLKQPGAYLIKKEARATQTLPSPEQHALESSQQKSIRPTSRYVDKARLERAKQVGLHDKIRRFAPGASAPIINSARNDFSPIQKTPDKPAAKTASVVTTAPAVSAHPRLLAILDQGLDSATSHLQPKLPKAKRQLFASKWLPVGTLGLAAILLISFFAYQNIPNFALRIAAKQSGVHASMPAYTPNGFEFSGPILWSEDQLTIRFNAGGARADSYQIAQRSTQWTSENLLRDYVALNGRSYQTLQERGKTIYLYDNNATWVDGGTWFTINNSASLSSDQLLKIASSM